MPSVLIIEDEAVIRNALTRLLERDGLSVTAVESVEAATRAGSLSTHDVILADLRLPGRPGTDVIPLAEETPVIIMTSYASVRSAVDAMREGAIDYIAKPFDNDELRLTVRRAIKEHTLQRQNAALRAHVEADYPVSGIIGTCAPMQRVFERVRRVAPTDTSVLILGESGTGKELVARAVHEGSERRQGPLIAVNCAAIPESLIEAELFGHEKGAFTGATGAREGLVEAASGGTLFLDEIAELPPAAQARLLRVLQEGEIRRVGAARSRRVDIRLVAATHRDLPRMVEAGQFREDLYFRIQVMEIRLPPLRERGEDVPELARFLLGKACRRLNRPPLRFSDEALQRIRGYAWPGNVRELENAIERAVILTDSTQITADLLALPADTDTAAGSGLDLSLEEYFREFVREHEASLTETELARRLGISRKALWEKRQRLGIPRRRSA
ncbi:sigma-54-dependent transcriptional regulator [Spiribacter halobius]|uniref:Response regulator n=1 Tax=Sediminicurvatus halobius TaxID=2182432 RepID=A0A2U2N365_9GAMM|nr:sigma-54 dependent transcriptional regulator [Spiribacter halobius]PWG63550.1 response regulator [Spiribacter halobius]UEX79570.1 sigma-54 dependent transcriptional regulator [Spiribacter halobius]